MKTSIKILLFALLFIGAILAQDTTPTESVEETHTEEDPDHDHAHGHGSEGCEAETLEDYNLKLHIGSLFILLGISLVAVTGPWLLYKLKVSWENNRILVWALRIGKFFGTGVILATAFIHMLPESFELFESECIPEGWHKYHGWGGLFPMIAALLIQFIEFAALCELDKVIERRKNNSIKPSDDNSSSSLKELKDVKSVDEEKGHTAEHEHEHLDCEGHTHGLLMDHDTPNLTVYILEFGIAIHSILIGIALSVSTGTEFKSLLAALSFHQFFEGLALGVRINELHPRKWAKPLMMCTIYSLTTPLGIAIGLGVRLSYNANSPNAILSSAILDSFAAGILLYNSLCNILGSEINQNKEFRSSTMMTKIVCFCAMWLGAAAMAVIGIWA